MLREAVERVQRWLRIPGEARRYRALMNALQDARVATAYEYPTVGVLVDWVVQQAEPHDLHDARVLVLELQHWLNSQVSDEPGELAARLRHVLEAEAARELCVSNNWKNIRPTTRSLLEVKKLRAKVEERGESRAG